MRNRPTARQGQPLPRTVTELIDELASRYPELRPTPGHSTEQIMFDAGARSVVLHLLTWQEQTRQKDRQPDVSY